MVFSCFIALLLLFLLFPQKKSFEIDFLDVGQGDGIYLCTGGGTSMFIDGGSTDVKQVGKYRILPFFKGKRSVRDFLLVCQSYGYRSCVRS